VKIKRPKSPLQKKASHGFKGYPIATVAFYGPDDKCATKVAVGIAVDENEPKNMQRWFAEHDVRRDPTISKEILEFIALHNVRSVVMTDRIIGCPHEEGIDYPDGEKCPRCPFWAHRDRWSGDVLH
jgi:hypothetical protein